MNFERGVSGWLLMYLKDMAEAEAWEEEF
jgi:hypothetical protein